LPYARLFSDQKVYLSDRKFQPRARTKSAVVALHQTELKQVSPAFVGLPLKLPNDNAVRARLRAHPERDALALQIGRPGADRVQMENLNA
jgi:hypothetical protein